MAKKVPTGSRGATIPASSLADYPLKPAAEVEAQIRRQKAEDALHTLSRAEEHRKDKRLMDDVKKLAREKMNHYSSLCK
jgi:hypothetical protein